MNKNPYEIGDQTSRNNLWTLSEGLVVEVISDEDKTVNYYNVELFSKDIVLCKALSQFGGSQLVSGSTDQYESYGMVCPFYVGDRVLVGFVDSNPDNQAFILGSIMDTRRKLPPIDDVTIDDVRIIVPKDRKIIEKSNNKVTIVNKTTKDADDGTHLIYAERGMQISVGAQSAINNTKPPQKISDGILINTHPDGNIDIESGEDIHINSDEGEIHIVSAGNLAIGVRDPNNNYIKGLIAINADKKMAIYAPEKIVIATEQGDNMPTTKVPNANAGKNLFNIIANTFSAAGIPLDDPTLFASELIRFQNLGSGVSVSCD